MTYPKPKSYDDIYESNAFKLLAEGMKDRNALGICIAVVMADFWSEFEERCKEVKDEIDAISK